MPINFYVKSNLELDDKTKYLRFSLDGDNTKTYGDTTKKFFQYITYVGCFNLNYIFVQMENRLYMMNLYPFLESFIREWISNANSRLIIFDSLDSRNIINLRDIVYNFLNNKKLMDRVNVEQILDRIFQNRENIYQEYGIKISKAPGEDTASVTSFPVFEKFMGDCLITDELAYFLIRLFNNATTQTQRSHYFIEFLSSFFRESEGTEKMELSPMNDKYS